jgi:hypothetical protein
MKSFQLEGRVPCLNCLGSKALCPEPVHSLYDSGYGASVRPREASAHAFLVPGGTGKEVLTCDSLNMLSLALSYRTRRNVRAGSGARDC